MTPDLILQNGRITTLDPQKPEARELVVKDGRIVGVVTGRTVGGLELYPEKNRMSRLEVLRLYTRGSAWFSAENDKKGGLNIGQLADLAVLSADFLEIPEDEIRALESVLTIVGGKPVYGSGSFRDEAPPPFPCCRTGRRWRSSAAMCCPPRARCIRTRAAGEGASMAIDMVTNTPRQAARACADSPPEPGRTWVCGVAAAIASPSSRHQPTSPSFDSNL